VLEGLGPPMDEELSCSIVCRCFVVQALCPRAQLETVYVLEGLGPPMDEEQRSALSDVSFEQQARKPCS